MKTSQGIFIVIDGIDGSGKSTQIELLGKYLTEKNIPFKVANFPRYGQNVYADLVTRYLEGEFGSIDEVNPYLIALAYAGDRLLAKPLIENGLKSGKVVIANRYVSASKAHLGANLPSDKREEFMGWLDRLEYQTNCMPKENLTILLNIDPKVGQDNALHKNKPEVTDIHEESVAHLEKAAQIYFELSQSEENWEVIDCMKGENMKPPQKIHQEILQLLEGKIF